MAEIQYQYAFGLEALIAALGFIAVIMFVASYAYKKRIGATIYDFFLASRLLGYLVLGLSLYATQYSGNSFIGYTARSYRDGFFFLVYPLFMITIPVFIVLAAVRLIPLATKYGITSPVDYIRFRFSYGNNSGKLLAAIIGLSLLFFVWGTFIQFFEQSIAMGYLGEVSSGGLVPYMVMVTIFTLGIITLVTLGGFRGAALSNAIMGIVMLAGLVGTLILYIKDYGSIGDAVATLAQKNPSLVSTPPSITRVVNWVSTLFLVGIAASLYIDILQHVLAARDTSTFRRIFLFVPYFYILTPVTLVLIGVIGAAALPGLTGLQTERIVPILIVQASASDPLSKPLGILWLMAVLSATISTASLALMSVGVAVMKEVYRALKPTASEREVVLATKILIALLGLLAIAIVIEPRHTIWRWTEIKFEGLIQVFPAVTLSLYIPWINTRGVFSGMALGGAVALALSLTGYATIQGLHAGLVGLLINIATCLAVSRLTSKPEETKYVVNLLEPALRTR